MPDRQQRGQQQRERTLSPDNDVTAVSKGARRTPEIAGIHIPCRDPSTRREVGELYRDFPHLQRRDRRLAVACAAVWLKWRRQAEILDKLGDSAFITGDGKPRQLLGDWRDTTRLLLATWERAGLTPSGRASLGLDVARFREMAAKGTSEAMGEADVLQLEQRILRHLGADTPQHEQPKDGQEPLDD